VPKKVLVGVLRKEDVLVKDRARKDLEGRLRGEGGNMQEFIRNTRAARREKLIKR